MSRRYVDDEPEFWFPEVWRGRADNVKQGSSSDSVDLGSFSWDGKDETRLSGWDLSSRVDSYCEGVLGLYNALLKAGVAPEQARMVLPQNMMTEWIWSGTLFAFVKMLKLRLDPHAQQETREVAEQIAVHVKELFPVSFSALMEN